MLHQQIEKAGTGGGLARRMFADFLDQAGQIYSRPIYELAAALYEESAKLWSRIAADAQAGKLNGAAQRLEEIYKLENRAISIFSSFEDSDI
jgi:hypothetical protein